MRQVLLLSLLLASVLALSVKPQWSTPAGGQENFGKCSKIENDVLYMPGVSRGSFKAISTVNGTVLWNNKGSDPTDSEDHCYTVISSGKYLVHLYYTAKGFNLTKTVRVYHKSNGAQLWKRNLPFNSVSWTSEVLLLISHHKDVALKTTVRSHKLSNGRLLKEYNLPSEVKQNAEDYQVNSRYFPDTKILLVYIQQEAENSVPTLWSLNYQSQVPAVLWKKELLNLDHSSPDSCVLDNSGIFLRLNSTDRNYVVYSLSDIEKKLYALSPAPLTAWINEAPILLTKDDGFAVETQVTWYNESLINTTWVLHSLTPGQDSKVVSKLTLQTLEQLTSFAVNKPNDMFLLDSTTHNLYNGDVRTGWQSSASLEGLPANTFYSDKKNMYTNTRVLGASAEMIIVQGYDVEPNSKGKYAVKNPKVYGFSRK